MQSTVKMIFNLSNQSLQQTVHLSFGLNCNHPSPVPQETKNVFFDNNLQLTLRVEQSDNFVFCENFQTYIKSAYIVDSSHSIFHRHK